MAPVPLVIRVSVALCVLFVVVVCGRSPPSDSRLVVVSLLCCVWCVVFACLVGSVVPARACLWCVPSLFCVIAVCSAHCVWRCLPGRRCCIMCSRGRLLVWLFVCLFDCLFVCLCVCLLVGVLVR